MFKLFICVHTVSFKFKPYGVGGWGWHLQSSWDIDELLTTWGLYRKVAVGGGFSNWESEEATKLHAGGA
jgi:hypothetical protein